jgi:hypothetical protein
MIGDFPRQAPAIPPVAVELGSALIAEDTGSSWKLFAEDVPALRHDIERLVGLRAPGIRFRGSDAVEPLAFTVIVEGLADKTGHLDPDVGDPPPLRLEPVLAAVGRAILGDPASFVVVDDLRRAVLSVADQARSRELAQALDLLAVGRRQDRVARLLRALIADGVHIGGWPGTIVPLLASGATGDGIPVLDDPDPDVLPGTCADLRGRLRDRLVGNLNQVRRYRIPRVLEDELTTPDKRREIAATVDAVLSGTGHPGPIVTLAAAVVSSPSARLVLQGLLRAEGSPHVALSEDEADSPVLSWPDRRATGNPA